jgi:hypothetical protein
MTAYVRVLLKQPLRGHAIGEQILVEREQLPGLVGLGHVVELSNPETTAIAADALGVHKCDAALWLHKLKAVGTIGIATAIATACDAVFNGMVERARQREARRHEPAAARAGDGRQLSAEHASIIFKTICQPSGR